jgi:hypothetical protein
MDEQTAKDQPQSRAKKGSSTFRYVAIVIVVLLVAGFYFFTQKGPFPPSTDHEENTTSIGEKKEDKQTGQKSGRLKEDTAASDIDSLQKNHSITSGDSPLQKNGTQIESPTSPAPASKDISALIQQRPAAGDNHQRLIEEINSFYAYLDQQPYMQNFAQKESSKVYFSSLLQKIANNPPVVHRETDDLITLLQNTAHFFRILGKDNINILKEILEKEKNSFEHILKAFYGLTYQPEDLKKEYLLSIPPDVRTDYAAFFLNTMGGRLYLLRRDPTTRMVINFYAIITIDRANNEGNGGHGIDLRPLILSLIDEIENGGSRLRLKDEYLDVLYDLQEKYN